MNKPSYQIVKEKFSGLYDGDALLIDVSSIRNNYDYIGLWYAKDGSEQSFITTEIFYSQSEKKPEKPDEYDSEIKENAFKQVNKFEISRDHNWVWISARNENYSYCNLKMGDIKKDRLYVSYKLIENKSFGFDLLDKGIFKGGSAEFIEVKCIHNNITEALMYLILMNDIPPKDWNIDDTYIGIENLPVFTPVFKFVSGRKYGNWFDQNPLK